MTNQESDYLAIRSGSKPLCDICIGGGSNFHARGVLAVASILPQQHTVMSFGGMNEVEQLLM